MRRSTLWQIFIDLMQRTGIEAEGLILYRRSQLW